MDSDICKVTSLICFYEMYCDICKVTCICFCECVVNSLHKISLSFNIKEDIDC
jgi:hypothetical protein